jgi:DNA polymerase-3 subunit gamma/tau
MIIQAAATLPDRIRLIAIHLRRRFLRRERLRHFLPRRCANRGGFDFDLPDAHPGFTLHRPLMSYQVFARKYRPQNFDDVVGQEHVTQTLKNAIEQQRLAQAYLFVGPRGTGKTSTARIFAKSLNCVKGPTVNPCGVCDLCREIAAGTSLNVLEFDAASNTQVDKIREIIIDNVKYAPASGRYKLYIVDEVHMLSNSSFNALLKTLEEPPAHVKFVFATTDVQKVPTTIVSRCQRFDLRRIPAHLIAEHLQFIAGREGIALDAAAAEAISKGAEGGLRDAESMLDQLVAFCGNSITEADVLKIFGFTSSETVHRLCQQILDGDSSGALAAVHDEAESGKDLSRLMGDLIGHLRDLLIAKADPAGLKSELGEQAVAALSTQAAQLPVDRLLELIEQFAAAESRMKWAPNKKLHFEIAVIKAIQTLGQATLTEILDTLGKLRAGEPIEARPGRSGPPAPTAPPPARKPAPARSRAAVEAPAQAATPPEPLPEPKADTPVVAEAVSESFTASETGPADLWLNVVSEIRKRRPLISSWIEAGKLVSSEKGTALLGFPPEQALAHESLSRPNNRKFLEEVFSALTGEPMNVRCEIREGLVIDPLPPAEATPAQAPVDPMAEFKNDPLIRTALEIFKGELA